MYHSPWILFVKQIVCDCGFPGVWQSQSIPTGLDWFSNNISQRLNGQFIQKYNSDIGNSPKAINYIMFKHTFQQENYLIDLPPGLWIPLCKFRCRNHRLPVEKFRQNSDDRNLRYCILCHTNEVGDEFHYLLKCPFFAEQLLLLLDNNICPNPSMHTFKNVMNTSGRKLIKIAKFIQIVLKKTK